MWQITAVDTRTRIADARIATGRPNAQTTVTIVDLVRRRWSDLGYAIGGLLTDNGAGLSGIPG